MNLISKRRRGLLAAVLIGAALLAGCSRFMPQPPEEVMPTVAPTTAPVAIAPATATTAPTATVTPRPTATATRTPTPSPSPTTAPTTAPTRPPTAVPPAAVTGPKVVTITEGDIAKFVSDGALAQYGGAVTGLKVRFANGRMQLTADSASYGPLQLNNIDLVGRPVARNGVVSLAVDSMSPGGFAASMLPSVANQALAQYTSQWYVEDVQVKDGRIELTVR